MGERTVQPSDVQGLILAHLNSSLKWLANYRIQATVRAALKPDDSHDRKTSFREKWWGGGFPFDPTAAPVFYGWIIVVIATVGMLFSIPGQTMGFTVFTDILMVELGLSRFALSCAYCVGTVVSGLSLPWFGRVLDRWGERKMAVASSLATSCVLFYLSCAAPFSKWVCVLLPSSMRATVSFTVITLGFFLIRAAAQGALTLACRNVICKWFNYRRGFALAISGAFVSAGFSVAPRFLDILVERISYQGAWIVMGFLTMGVMTPLAWAFFRDNPEDVGLEMDGKVIAAPLRENLDMRIKRDFRLGEAVRTYAFWVFNLSFAFYAFYATAFTFHIVSLGEEFGFTKALLLKLFFPMAAISVATNLGYGWVNPAVRLKYLLMFMNVGAALGAVGLFRLNAPFGVAAYVIGNGIAGGGFVCLSGLVWPRFYGRLWLGAIGGAGMSAMVIASGAGPLVFGWVSEVSGSYGPVLHGSLFVPAFLAVLSCWADNPQRRL